MAGSRRKELCQKPTGGTALRALDFDMAISDSLDRTYVPDKGLRRLPRETKVLRHVEIAAGTTVCNRPAVRRSRNVGKTVERSTLRGRDARIDNVRCLEMFQAESKWEM